MDGWIKIAVAIIGLCAFWYFIMGVGWLATKVEALMTKLKL